ncbi:XAC2610-related protein [Flavobacterium procerum]|uniref:XAC2610-related protein n=1 Tax=Flavobacterium procerum TaxID=1455569 RepID=A0ABV6BN72_9FLAO
MKIAVWNILILFAVNCFGQNNVEFYQKDKTKIRLKLLVDSEKLEVYTSKNNKSQVLHNIEISTSITDNRTNIEVEDYNFDGYKDFSVYHTDDGMGVYTVYQIFIYNPATAQFKEVKMPSDSAAKCGEFSDVEINKKNKTFESTCRGAAQWHTDKWKFNKNNKLVLLKN